MQASPAVQRSFRWSAPGKTVAVDLPLPVVDRIAAQVRSGLQDTGRGVEVGGLLLGRVRREGGLTVVRVEDVDPVQCEHVAGPSYMLSASDRHALEAQLRQHKGAIVGFYRSNTRKEFAVTVEDVALMGWYFAKPSDVFLLLHAGAVEPMCAAFVLWQGRGMTQKAPEDEFPFDSDALTGRSHSDTPRVLPPAREKGLKAGWLAAAAIAVGVAAGLIYERAGSPSAAAPEPRRLSAQAAVPPAEIAPQPEPQPAAVSTPPQPVAPTAVAPTVIDPPRVPEFVAPPTVAPPAVTRAIAAPPAVAPRTTHRADRRILAFLPPATTPSPAPEIPDAPPVALPSPSGPAIEAAALVPTTAPPASPHTTGAAVSVSVSAVTRGLGPKFVPPAAVEEVRPDIPSHLRERLMREAQMVRVKVYVDRSGKVGYAELLSDGTGSNRELATLAVFAARRWQFAPANRARKPVEAQAVLRFRFGPNTP